MGRRTAPLLAPHEARYARERAERDAAEALVALVRAIRKGTVLLPTRDGFITASFPGADELEAAMKAETTLSTFERA